MESLKKCPFCGSAAVKLHKKISGHRDINGKLMSRPNEFSTVVYSYQVRCHGNECHARGSIKKSAAEAVMIWNVVIR